MSGEKIFRGFLQPGAPVVTTGVCDGIGFLLGSDFEQTPSRSKIYRSDLVVKALRVLEFSVILPWLTESRPSRAQLRGDQN